MKRLLVDPTICKARLRQRLGLPAKRWSVRIKPGGWITLPVAVVRLLHLKTGDVIAWKSTPRGLEGKRIPAGARRRTTRNDFDEATEGGATLFLRSKAPGSGKP